MASNSFERLVVFNGKCFIFIIYNFWRGISWLNVLNVERKLVLLRRLGRWLAERTRVAKEMSLRLDSLSTVEKLTDQS
jgi:hypothetical protein